MLNNLTRYTILIHAKNYLQQAHQEEGLRGTEVGQAGKGQEEGDCWATADALDVSEGGGHGHGEFGLAVKCRGNRVGRTD